VDSDLAALGKTGHGSHVERRRVHVVEDPAPGLNRCAVRARPASRRGVETISKYRNALPATLPEFFHVLPAGDAAGPPVQKMIGADDHLDSI